MKFSEAQAFFVAQIAADPTLGSLNAVIVYDPNQTQDDQRAAINAVIARVGFCIEIGLPHIPHNDHETNNAGVTFARALVPVYIAEDRSLPHTPTGAVLTDYVETAINSRRDTRHMTGLHSKAAAESDNGLVLWELVFGTQVQSVQSLPVIPNAGRN